MREKIQKVKNWYRCKIQKKHKWEIVEEGGECPIDTKGLPEGYSWTKLGRERCKICGEERMAFYFLKN